MNTISAVKVSLASIPLSTKHSKSMRLFSQGSRTCLSTTLLKGPCRTHAGDHSLLQHAMVQGLQTLQPWLECQKQQIFTGLTLSAAGHRLQRHDADVSTVRRQPAVWSELGLLTVSFPAIKPVRASWGPKKRAAVNSMPGSDLQDSKQSTLRQ